MTKQRSSYLEFHTCENAECGKEFQRKITWRTTNPQRFCANKCAQRNWRRNNISDVDDDGFPMAYGEKWGDYRGQDIPEHWLR